MRYGIEIVPFGDFGDPRSVVRLARAAEAAGWEGLFVWDHLGFVSGIPGGDPWVILAAVAAATERLILGTAVTPLPRRRPQVLAHTLTTLDVLSGGRVVFGAGLGGVVEEFTAFGEQGDSSRRATMLDEGLEVLNRLWSGQRVDHHGDHYTVDGVALSPRPLQRPRIPVWIGGDSPPALRRAARWDGWVVSGIGPDGSMTLTPAALAEKVAYIREHRQDGGAFQVAITGCTSQADTSIVCPYIEAGATWWLESLFGLRGTVAEMLARLQIGPPR